MSTNTMKDINEKNIAIIQNDICYIKKTLDKIDCNFSEYVKKDEFNPVRNIVYGAVSLALTAMLGAIIALILK